MLGSVAAVIGGRPSLSKRHPSVDVDHSEGGLDFAPCPGAAVFAQAHVGALIQVAGIALLRKPAGRKAVGPLSGAATFQFRKPFPKPGGPSCRGESGA